MSTQQYDGDAQDEMDPEDDVVVLTDEEGNEKAFGVLAIIEDPEEGLFALLSALDELEDESQQEAPLDVFIFHYTELDDGIEEFSAVEDEALFQKIAKLADELMNEAGEE